MRLVNSRCVYFKIRSSSLFSKEEDGANDDYYKRFHVITWLEFSSKMYIIYNFL